MTRGPVRATSGVKRGSREALFVVIYVLVGLVAAALAGYVTLGRLLFQQHLILLRYLVFGLSASLIYLAIRTGNWGHSLYLAALMFVGYVALTPPLRLRTGINGIAWTVPVSGAFILSSFLFRRLSRLPLGKFIIMGLLAGIGYGIGTILFLVINPIPLSWPLVLDQAIAGLRLGGLLGFGFEAVDYVRSRASRPAEPGATG